MFVVGGLAGAVIGWRIARHRHPWRGVIVGALAGVLIGLAAFAALAMWWVG